MRQHYLPQFLTTFSHSTLYSIKCTSSWGVRCWGERIEVLGGRVINRTFDRIGASWIFHRAFIGGGYREWFRFSGIAVETFMEYNKGSYTFHILRIVTGTGARIFRASCGAVPTMARGIFETGSKFRVE